MRLIPIVMFSLVLIGCGGSTDPIPCVGTSCSCPADSACDLGGSDCAGDSCTAACGENSDCVGSCGASCSLDCAAGATCDVTVGTSSSISCADGATCHITCTDSCSISCAPGATCDVVCPGESAAQPIEGTGGCG